jgi:hypothetical protein
MHLQLALAGIGTAWMLIAVWFVLPRFDIGRSLDRAVHAFLISVGVILIAAILARVSSLSCGGALDKLHVVPAPLG